MRAKLILTFSTVLGLATSLSAQTPRSPEAYFGHVMGADRMLIDWKDRFAYHFRSIYRQK